MQHITRIQRNQLILSSLENTITADNPVRFIDFFVNIIDRIRKSKRRTQPDYARLQHQTQHQHPGRSRFDSQAQDLELTLQEKGLAFYKNDLFKAHNSQLFCATKSELLKITHA